MLVDKSPESALYIVHVMEITMKEKYKHECEKLEKSKPLDTKLQRVWFAIH